MTVLLINLIYFRVKRPEVQSSNNVEPRESGHNHKRRVNPSGDYSGKLVYFMFV